MEKIISIVGLTSSGKSSLGIKLAQKFNGEIVSADSRQVYKGLDWCSGKVTQEEQNMVKHHLLDVANLGEQYTLFDFQKQAYDAIDDILKRGKVPFLVGGTGLYSRAVVEGYNLVQEKPNQELRNDLEGKSIDELLKICDELKIELDGEVNKRRIVRAIEIAQKEKLPNKPRYEVLQIGVWWDRDEIYERIKERLEMRMPNMIQEIKQLVENGTNESFLRSLGLEAKFVVDYLNGKFSSYEEFFEELFKEERHFAKRQNTWYNKEQNLHWIDAKNNLLKNAEKLVEEFLAQ